MYLLFSLNILKIILKYDVYKCSREWYLKMIVVKECDKGKTICHKCGLTTTTHNLRHVDFNDNRGFVKNITAGICDKCNEVVSIPSQSILQIRSEYNKLRSL